MKLAECTWEEKWTPGPYLRCCGCGYHKRCNYPRLRGRWKLVASDCKDVEAGSRHQCWICKDCARRIGLLW